jgi:hypothetical protein
VTGLVTLLGSGSGGKTGVQIRLVRRYEGAEPGQVHWLGVEHLTAAPV